MVIFYYILFDVRSPADNKRIVIFLGELLLWTWVRCCCCSAFLNHVCRTRWTGWWLSVAWLWRR